MPRVCKCERDKYATEQALAKQKEKQIRLDSIMKNSLMDTPAKVKTFSNWDSEKGNQNMYDLGLRYTDKFTEMKKEGVGLMIYGPPGNGKTYLTCCIANKLLEQFISVVCVSINSLLDRIKETYNKGGKEAEADILRCLGRADLLIIDDLGTEKVSEWSVSTIYNIIDSRYRSKLPLIITTNLAIDPKNTNGIIANIYGRRAEDRLFEMCTPIENKQSSIRLREAAKKTEIIKALLE